MKCPSCGHLKDKVVDSREDQHGTRTRRRRECLTCRRRFTTYEYKEEVPLMVVKKDGRREQFDRNKVLAGVVKACEKRPISMQKIEEVIESVEREIQRRFDREISSREIGELLVRRLSQLDDVAYVRFASVYRQFKDISQFMDELKDILDKGRPKAKIQKRKKSTAR
jgi:transcriptional repressor NrdR